MDHNMGKACISLGNKNWTGWESVLIKDNGMELHDSEKEMSPVMERLTNNDTHDDVGIVYFLRSKLHFNLNKYHHISYLDVESNRPIFR